MNKYIVILTSTDNKDNATLIANNLVDNHLAACVQITKGIAIYNYNNKKETTKEYLLTIKTRKSLYKIVENKIKEYHIDKLPEIISYDITNISDDYAKWIDENTKEELKWI